MDLPATIRPVIPVIDLGLVAELGVEPAAPERRGLAAAVWLRRIVVGALLGAVGLGGAVPPAVPALLSVGVLPVAAYLGFQVGAGAAAGLDVVYTVSAGNPLAQSPLATLGAYRLEDGSRLWRIPLPLRTSLPDAVPVGSGVVLVTNTANAAPGERTVAVDARTGARLWSSPLSWLRTVPVRGTVLVGAYLEADGEPGISPLVDTPSPRHPPPLQLTALDVRTGRVAWSVRVPAGYWTGLPRGGTGEGGTDDLGSADAWYAVTVSSDGWASTIDLTTGATLARAHLPVLVPPDLRVIGDWLLVPIAGRDGARLFAYRAATLGLQWTLPVRSAHLSTAGCGIFTCFTDDIGVRAVDLATGRVAWTSADWTPTGVVGGWLSAVHPRPDPAGQPVISELLAVGSGAPLLAMTGWVPVPGPAAPQTDRYLVVSAANAFSDVAAATWLGLVRQDGGRPRIQPLGPLPAGPDSARVAGNGCATAAVYLVCEMVDHTLRIWRYRG